MPLRNRHIPGSSLILATGCALLLALASTASGQVRTNARFEYGAPTTTNNDDSCDISVMPAATLLLPYFEVSTAPNVAYGSPNTVFSITNVSPVPAIANVVLWTDRGFPVLDFRVYLTGYDAQRISLWGLLMLGELPATSSSTARGTRSLPDSSNPNLDPNAATSCSAMPTVLPNTFTEEVRDALTVGTFFGASGIGNHHPGMAIGYVTVDVVSSCDVASPLDGDYYASDLLYDNVLTGEYLIDEVGGPGYSVNAESMVHIRAIPEGGPAGASVSTNLPYTFYDRLSRAHAVSSDRRQPLPSAFAARWIDAGTGSFETSIILWREPFTGAGATNASYANNFMPLGGMVRFDESENPSSYDGCTVSPCFEPATVVTSKIEVDDSFFPPNLSGEVGGWLYLDLHNRGSSNYSPPPDGYGSSRPSQNWVIVEMRAEGRFATHVNAPSLGNGCSAVTLPGTIGPAPNVTP